jgi:hypothetical protein
MVAALMLYAGESHVCDLCPSVSSDNGGLCHDDGGLLCKSGSTQERSRGLIGDKYTKGGFQIVYVCPDKKHFYRNLTSLSRF